MAVSADQLKVLQTPPTYCQYVKGPCDQDFLEVEPSDAVFLYSSRPTQIAAAIFAAVEHLNRTAPTQRWRVWTDFRTEGQIIFCEIAKAMRFARTVVADVTTLNFNLLFEIGFALGLELPVIPVRDTTFLTDKDDFRALGLLDTMGYVDFANGRELADELREVLPARALPSPPRKVFWESPLFVLPGPISTEGTVRMMSVLKKSDLRFRTHDQIEKPRFSLHEARRQVQGSVGVFAHLLSPQREGARVHNGMCALLCGMAMAQEKVVCMLQEEHVEQPIDYRDVVQTYEAPDQLPHLLEEPIRQVVRNLQTASPRRIAPPETALERLDLGDTAAENEITGLREYFVRTSQFRQAVRGRARLVVGRKGSGKTAIFYEVRDAVSGSRSRLVLDLRPEGHQFKKLREAVLSELSPGAQEHTVTAFWNYILICEIAHKLLEREVEYAHRDPELLLKYEELEAAYLGHSLSYGDDLSQRLLRQVDRLVKRYGELDDPKRTGQVTEFVYGGDVHSLNEAVAGYLEGKDEVWILIDNLDKSWPTRGSSSEDILILRGLLEAARKLQRQLEDRDVDLKCLVFIRADIYEHLLEETPDKGKDTAIQLDWYDADVFQHIIQRRIETSTDITGEWRDVWQAFVESHIGTQDSFGYMLERTLMRPRDLLTFVQRAIEVALNREHTKIATADILRAEESYSQDMVVATAHEIQDTAPELDQVLFAFWGAPPTLTQQGIEGLLSSKGFETRAMQATIETLVWFGFLGVEEEEPGEAQYAYQVRYNVDQLLQPVRAGAARYVIHPAFRAGLNVS